MEARRTGASGGSSLLLSGLVGRPVVTADGRRIGRVKDLSVRLHVAHPVVHRLLVRANRRTTYLLPWEQVSATGTDPFTLPPGTDLPGAAVAATDLPLENDELLLARDVLDTEVVDLEGHRLSRVADVFLLRNEDGRLEVAAVDVGVGAVLRRIGLGLLAGRTRPVAVDWQELHLTSSRGHVVQLSTATAGFRQLHGDELAELLARLSTDKATDVMRSVAPERAAAAVHRSHPLTGRRLMHALGHEDAERLVRAAPSAQAADLTELRRHVSPVRRRRFRRTAGWRVRRPPARTPRPPGARAR
ncbi:PRC-barrel domain-containing protein [Nocardioides mesophilus]|uniref:PRC-barrel domain-containing protein n=1 Tax=Nocardioides mesophilus TaxID=433659 RepID=A0A7G9RD52_9ACTN|nr:PRC-barrel domain-containing protein [Nocardioides mesophilus]